MSFDPPKTPPAWFAYYERRQEEQQRELNALKSRVGANSLATSHQVGEVATMVREFVREMRGSVAAVKEAVADVAVKVEALEKHVRGPK